MNSISSTQRVCSHGVRGAQNAPGSRAGPAVVALHRGALGSRACRRGESTRAHAATVGRAARAVVAGDGFMMSRDVLLMNVRGGPAARALSTDTEEATSPTEATPIVIIDNIKDPFATVVSIQFGDYLEGLIDTVAALKNLGLNIVRAKFTDLSEKKNRFYVTDATTHEKVLDPQRMEEIRLTILRNMVSYHPESQDKLAVGTMLAKPSLKMNKNPLGPRAQNRIATKISVQEDERADGTRSVLYLECADRPGLLVDIVKVLNDLSIDVTSAEVDTVGFVVKDAFFITYRDEALNNSMVTLVENALSYYLNLAEIEGEESY